MSRTIRRTNVTETSRFIFPETETGMFWGITQPRWKNVYKDDLPYSQYVKREVARFHSDIGFHFYERPLPRWVRNKRQERPFRQEVKRGILKVVRYDIDISVKRPPKDGWLFW
jgi:hypothetical protein